MQLLADCTIFIIAKAMGNLKCFATRKLLASYLFFEDCFYSSYLFFEYFLIQAPIGS